MTKKKSGFWTFVFSLLPGAAEMYMGFMKMGVSLMALFFGVAFLSGFFAQGAFLLANVVIWFYGFFHAHNLRAMEDEEFYALEDDYIFRMSDLDKEFFRKNLTSRSRKIIAAVLILIGIAILWNNLLDLLLWFLPGFMQEIFWNISYRIPQVVLGIGIIAVGVALVRGKKKELLEDNTEEERADGGAADNQNP